MPRQSDREQLLNEFEKTLEILAFDSKEASADFIEIMTLYFGLNSCRYLNPRLDQPKLEGLRNLFWDLSDEQFKQYSRMDKTSFVHILGLIEDDPVFHNNSRIKQMYPWYQLAVALHRFGTDGNGSSIDGVALQVGISHGSIANYTRRVIKALLALKDNYIRWPNAAERAEISHRFALKHGLFGAVGIVDGTPVHFFQRPGLDGEIWWTRKMRYSMNVQLICDDNGRIIYYILGWPGSVYDATIFNQCRMCLTPAEFFSLGEYLLADAGYTLTFYCCTPYRNPAAQVPANKVFNELFSSGRVTIEHVNGRWKGRFASLKGFRACVHCYVYDVFAYSA